MKRPSSEEDSEMADPAAGDDTAMQVDQVDNHNNDDTPDYSNNYGDYDDDVDDIPAFLEEGDAVEVPVDDDRAPMDDDDDDDDDDDEDHTRSNNGHGPSETVVVDMARATIRSHTEPVYAVGCSTGSASTGTLSDSTNHREALLAVRIISGGGDDKAFWHDVSFLNNNSGGSQHAITSTSTCLDLQYQFRDSVSAIAGNSEFVAFDTTKPPNPKWMAVGALDGSIVLYGLDGDDGNEQQQQRPLRVLEGPTSDIEWLCWHPKGGNVLLAGSADATLWMYHTTLNKCMQVFVGHEASVTCGSFSADGKVAISGSADGTLRIWAPKTGKSKHVFRFTDNSTGNPPPALTCLATHGGPDLQLVIVGSEDGQAHICHVANKKHVASLRHYDPTTSHTTSNNNNDNNNDEEETMMVPSGVEAVGFCKSNPNWCATGGMDGVLKIWDLSNQGQCRHSCTAPSTTTNNNKSSSVDGITKLVWHPTAPLVLTSTCQGRIHLWDARNGQLLQTLTGHSDVINDMSVIFAPPALQQQVNVGGVGVGHAWIVTASDDHAVKIFDLDVDAAMAQAPQQIVTT